MNTYQVIISPRVVEQINSIKNYIADIKLNPVVAIKIAESLFDELEKLKMFPERGFDADEKLGVKIDQLEKTYGIILLNGKYLVLYSINEKESIVNVAYLFSTKTDYASLFLK